MKTAEELRANVEYMQQNPGVYMCGFLQDPTAIIPVASVDGVLWSMKLDSPLDPDGFQPSATFEGPYPLRMQKKAAHA